jgi:hypothetical protein
LHQTFFPTNVLWSNYITVFNSFDFLTYVGNTLVVGIISTIGTLITTIFAAFAFARLNFRGKNVLFADFARHDDDPGRNDGHHQLHHRCPFALVRILDRHLDNGGSPTKIRSSPR